MDEVQMKCPYCNKPIGVEENPFHYETVSYYEDVKGKKKLILEYLAIACSNCGAVIGVTR